MQFVQSLRVRTLAMHLRVRSCDQTVWVKGSKCMLIGVAVILRSCACHRHRPLALCHAGPLLVARVSRISVLRALADSEGYRA